MLLGLGVIVLASVAGTNEGVTAWATVGLGAVTVILAAVSIIQALITRGALRAAERDTVEATRSRIDQQAPRVTLLAEASAECAAAWLVPLPPNARFRLVQHGGTELALCGWFTATNEGRSTALVSTPEGVMNLGQDIPVQNLDALRNIGLVRPTHNTFDLRPGDWTRLFVEVRRPLSSWVQYSARERKAHTVSVIVEDTFAEGIRDITDLVVAGEPIVPAGDDWRATGCLSELRVERTVRDYQRASSKLTP